MKTNGRPQVVVVTGASAGVGRAVAQAFARRGAKIGLLARGLDGLEGACREVEAAGGRGLVLPTDVADPDSVERMVAAALAEFGQLDVLVNNAGVNVFHEPLEMPPSEWERCFQIDLNGAWHCCRAALPHLLARGRGSIVNIASVHSFQIIPHCFPYPVAKHGLLGLTRALAIEYAARNIRVNAICPGYIETPMIGGALEHGMSERFAAAASLGRLGQPHEIGKVARFLLSDDASFLTGQAIAVDGGVTTTV